MMAFTCCQSKRWFRCMKLQNINAFWTHLLISILDTFWYRSWIIRVIRVTFITRVILGVAGAISTRFASISCVVPNLAVWTGIEPRCLALWTDIVPTAVSRANQSPRVRARRTNGRWRVYSGRYWRRQRIRVVWHRRKCRARALASRTPRPVTNLPFFIKYGPTWAQSNLAGHSSITCIKSRAV